MHQGNLLASGHYAVGLHTKIQEETQSHPQLDINNTYADNWDLAGDANDVDQAFSLVEQTGPNINIHLGRDKCQAIFLNGKDNPNVLASIPQCLHGNFKSGIPNWGQGILLDIHTREDSKSPHPYQPYSLHLHALQILHRISKDCLPYENSTYTEMTLSTRRGGLSLHTSSNHACIRSLCGPQLQPCISNLPPVLQLIHHPPVC